MAPTIVNLKPAHDTCKNLIETVFCIHAKLQHRDSAKPHVIACSVSSVIMQHTINPVLTFVRTDLNRKGGGRGLDQLRRIACGNGQNDELYAPHKPNSAEAAHTNQHVLFMRHSPKRLSVLKFWSKPATTQFVISYTTV